jgi:hypothetical protein
MPTFVLSLVHDEQSLRIICSVLGEGSGFDGSDRRFEDKNALIQALTQAGIQPERYEPALRDVLSGKQGSLDLHQNEAQKLGVLHTDTSE